MLYIQYIYIFLPLSLSTYIQWCAVKGGRMWKGVEGCYKPSPFLRTVSGLCKILSENFPNYRSVGQSRFTQQVVVAIFPIWLDNIVKV